MVVLAIIGLVVAYQYYGRGLPDHTQLARYEPPITTRVYAADGRLMAEYAAEKRIFVAYDGIPRRVIEAFLSAEDKNFYAHRGIDFSGIVRAAITNLNNLGSDRRPVGASTITQQVAKNFLLGSELSLDRKIKEAILAFRLDRAFSKARILELYLNQIYLGNGSYGVAAAALNYFDKHLDELTTAQAALLAGLPKAPANYDPIKQPQAAKTRRDWVIGRMLEDGHITEEEAQEARSQGLGLNQRPPTQIYDPDYFAEEVRRELARRYGDSGLYTGGYTVYTTVDSRLQTIAETVLRRALENYDRRFGYKGPVTQLDGFGGKTPPADWNARLAALPRTPGLVHFKEAVVLQVTQADARIGFRDGSTGRIPLSAMTWARSQRPNHALGPAVRKPSDVVAPGDVVLVEKRGGDGGYALRQIPQVEGALVAIDPWTGKVLAMAGGYSDEVSQFNRVTQAMRQPGSAFKPVVYACALEAGLTPSSVIVDAPVSYRQGAGEPRWKPSNASGRYYGPTTLRVALEQSRNVVAVRLADAVGMKKVSECAQRYGVIEGMPPYLAYALGAGETTLLRLTAFYAMLDNGGRWIEPSLIDRIQDRYGRVVFRQDSRSCPECRTAAWEDGLMPEVTDTKTSVTDPATAFQMVNMLQGVVERGTGKVVKDLKRPAAGKTGTSTDAKDVWFVGFTPELAAGVFIGFDEPRSLGGDAAGGVLAAPIFRDFMKQALASTPITPFRVPPEIRLVRVNQKTGRISASSSGGTILEAFKPGTTPPTTGPVVGMPAAKKKPSQPSISATGPSSGTGGLY